MLTCQTAANTKTQFDPLLPKTREKQKGAKKEGCKTGSKQVGKDKRFVFGEKRCCV